MSSLFANIISLMRLRDFNVASTEILFEMLGLGVKKVFSSNLGVDGKKNIKLINICEKLNSNIYISGSGGKKYLDLNTFQQKQINVIWQNWNDNYYYNKYGMLEWRDVSFIDFIARHGPQKLRETLTPLTI